ncbi:hypothetical protein PIB30_054580 [Stylosanthes scabra]|uniref:Uncharacterized protein n=1 Tax=Stylosanthes scabra TaxID=79078 RepID=A0ABU6VI54_9FABA|nr:hypothetical protein [Stylosanthes scabra]
MFSFSLRVIPDGAKPVPSIKLTARVLVQLGSTTLGFTPGIGTGAAVGGGLEFCEEGTTEVEIVKPSEFVAGVCER